MKYDMDKSKLSVFASRVRALRRVLNMTQEETSKALNVHRTSYTKYETDVAMPDAECMRNMALLFNVSLDYLMDLSDKTHRDTLDPEGMEESEIAMLAEFRRLNKTQRRRLTEMAIAMRRGDMK